MTTEIAEDVNMRKMDMNIPRVLPSLARVVWCPRNPQGSGLGRSVAPTRITMKQLRRESQAARKRDSVSVSSVLPEWSKGLVVGAVACYPATNRQAGCTHTHTHVRSPAMYGMHDTPEVDGLTMEFVGSRVARSSSKNFLFVVPGESGTCPC